MRRSTYICQPCLIRLAGLFSPQPRPLHLQPLSPLARTVTSAPLGSAATRRREYATRAQTNAAGLRARMQRVQRARAETMRLAREGEEGEDGPKFRDPDFKFFTQTEDGGLEELPDGDAFGDAFMGADPNTEQEMDQTEQEMLDCIRILKEDLHGPKIAAARKKKLETTIKRRVLELEKAAARDEADGDDDQSRRGGPAGDPQYPELWIRGFQHSQNSKYRVRLLNEYLRAESRRMARNDMFRMDSPPDVKLAWKLYQDARPVLAQKWTLVPNQVWDFLWLVFSWPNIKANPNRMHHVTVLSRDMIAAGQILRDRRLLLSLEAMFFEGFREEAIAGWDAAHADLGTQEGKILFTAYWKLGIRMLSVAGDMDRAQWATDQLLNSAHYNSFLISSFDSNDPHCPHPELPPYDAYMPVLGPLIRALATSEATRAQAIERYRQLISLLGASIRIEVYDEVIDAFLSADAVEEALQIFVDMMFAGAIKMRHKWRLPMAVSNQFFLGKWLKRLIGAGDLLGTYRVLLFMQKRGVHAAAIQLNGFISALFRSGSAENVARGESIGWAMILERMRFVDERRQASLNYAIEDVAKINRKFRVKLQEIKADERRLFSLPEWWEVDTLPSYVDRNLELKFVPSATLETLSVLARNYISRGLRVRVHHVWSLCERLEIEPSTFLMNHRIEAYALGGQVLEAYAFFKAMTMTREEQEKRRHEGADSEQDGLPVFKRPDAWNPIRPDANTWMALFNTLSVNREPSKSPYITTDADTNMSRVIFRDMVQMDWNIELDLDKDLPAQAQAAAAAIAAAAAAAAAASPDDASPPMPTPTLTDLYAHIPVPDFLPRRILFSMIKTHDFAGCVVAARALPRLFGPGFYPSQQLLVELLAGTPAVRNALATPRNARRAARGVRVLAGLAEGRRMELEAAGGHREGRRGAREYDPKRWWVALRETAVRRVLGVSDEQAQALGLNLHADIDAKAEADAEKMGEILFGEEEEDLEEDDDDESNDRPRPEEEGKKRKKRKNPFLLSREESERARTELNLLLERVILYKAEALEATPEQREPILEAAGRDMGVWEALTAHSDADPARRRCLKVPVPPGYEAGWQGAEGEECDDDDDDDDKWGEEGKGQRGGQKGNPRRTGADGGAVEAKEAGVEPGWFERWFRRGKG